MQKINIQPKQKFAYLVWRPSDISGQRKKKKGKGVKMLNLNKKPEKNKIFNLYFYKNMLKRCENSTFFLEKEKEEEKK